MLLQQVLQAFFSALRLAVVMIPYGKVDKVLLIIRIKLVCTHHIIIGHGIISLLHIDVAEIGICAYVIRIFINHKLEYSQRFRYFV